MGAAIGAEFEQLNKDFPGYGYGGAGYAKRYAALYGDGLTSDVLSNAVFLRYSIRTRATFTKVRAPSNHA